MMGNRIKPIIFTENILGLLTNGSTSRQKAIRIKPMDTSSLSYSLAGHDRTDGIDRSKNQRHHASLSFAID